MEMEREEIGIFREGFAAVRTNRGLGFIDTSGRVVIQAPANSPRVFTDIRNFRGGFAEVRQTDFDTWDIIDRQGAILGIRRSNNSWYEQTDGLLITRRRVAGGEEFAASNANGDEVVPPGKYNTIMPFHDATWAVISNEEWGLGLIDITGAELVTPTYDDLEWVNGIIVVTNDRKRGVIDRNGNILIPIQYDEIRYMGTGNIHVELNRKQGRYDTSGRMLIPCEFDTIWDTPRGNYVIVRDDVRGYGVFDITAGTEIIPVGTHEFINVNNDYNGGIFLVQLEDGMGVVNVSGNVAQLPDDFESVGVSSGLLLVRKDGGLGFVRVNF
jgi:hypothetical protein